MTPTTGSRRVAVTVRAGDLVRLDDGSTREVAVTPAGHRSSTGGLILTIRFSDGGGVRVNAGAELTVMRPE